jgi:putative Mg2+ transporter-C (MgtC) family protein
MNAQEVRQVIEWWEVLIRLAVATALGGIIGYQRERMEKPAGFRTHTLVALGSSLMMLVSVYPFLGQQADPSRIAAGVITGMGFLGAGTIIRQGSIVRGLTTAASLWVASGIGLAVGVGYYFAALVTTGLVFGILTVLKRIEIGLVAPRGLRSLIVTTVDRPGQIGKIGSALGRLKVDIRHIELETAPEEEAIVKMVVSVPDGTQEPRVLEELRNLEGIRDARWEE